MILWFSNTLPKFVYLVEIMNRQKIYWASSSLAPCTVDRSARSVIPPPFIINLIAGYQTSHTSDSISVRSLTLTSSLAHSLTRSLTSSLGWARGRSLPISLQTIKYDCLLFAVYENAQFKLNFCNLMWSFWR